MATNLGTLTLNLIAQTGLFTQGLNRAEQQTRSTARNMSNELNLVGRTFKDLQGTLMASFAGALTIGAAISKMDAYTGLQNRLKLVTTSQTELNQAMKDTFGIAQSTGQSWDSTAQVYQRFADNAKRLGITLQQTATLTDTVAKSISISGGSAASAEAALVQFGQALASGVLRGEEFNSISEQAPGLLKAIATGLDTNIGQLRAMAAEGKLTGDVVIKSLEKAKASVDDLFGKTDFTIGNSFTMLNNAAIQFVGEAGKSSGAAQILSTSIKGLADNLQLIADIAIIGGVALLTKALLSQTLVIKEAVIASVARRAAQAAEAESEIRLAALEVARSRRQAALAAQEVHLARLAYNDALTKNQRAAATVRLTQAEIAHRLALHQSTAALAANAAAQDALNVSRAAGARLLALVGGPIGAITLGVTALAAGYMYLQGRTAAANQKLEEQMEIAKKTKEELIALKGVQRDVAINDLQEAFDKQNIALRNLNNEFLGFIDNIGRTSDQSNKVYEVFEQARTGALSNADALERLNKLNLLTPEQKKQGLDLVNNYILQAQKSIDAEKALKIFGITVKITGNEAQNAAVKQLQQADALNKTAGAAENLKKVLDKLSEQRTDAQYTLMTAKNLGGDVEEAKRLLEYRKQLGLGSTGRQLNTQERSAYEQMRVAQKALQTYEDQINEAKKSSLKTSKQQTSEYEKQQKKLEQIKEDQARSRYQIGYEYADEFERMNLDYQKQIEEINKANFGSEQSKYLEAAKARYDFNTEMYLRQITEENDSFRWSEEYKLRYFDATQREIIEKSGRYNDEIKQIKLNSLKDQTEQELAWLELEKQQRLLNARQFYMSDAEYMQERYKLERDEIAKNLKLTQEERDARIAMNLAEEEYEKRKNLKSASMAWGQSYADMTGTGARFQIEQDRFNRYEESNALFESQIALAETAAEREAIWQAHNDRMAAIDADYQSKSLDLNMSYGADILGSMSSIAKNVAGENSSFYAAMFAMEKGMAVARSVMAIQVALAQASANPFPMNLAAMATVAMQTANIVATIQGVQAPTGMAHNGIDNIPKEGTWLLDGGERVLNPEQNKDLTRYLSDRQTANEQASNSADGINQFTINNFIDPNEIPQAMANPYGAKVFMNFIKLHKSTIRGMLGVP